MGERGDGAARAKPVTRRLEQPTRSRVMIDTLLSLFEAPALRTVAPGRRCSASRPGRSGASPCSAGRACRATSSRTRRCRASRSRSCSAGGRRCCSSSAARSRGGSRSCSVGVVDRRSRVPIDAALGGTLAVFFGLGLALMHVHPEARARTRRSIRSTATSSARPRTCARTTCG